MLRVEGDLTIKDFRNHAARTVSELRALLASGAPARPDPRRKNFYEVDAGTRVFYIHLTPGTGKVMFLAVWDKDFVESSARAQENAAAECFAAI